MINHNQINFMINALELKYGNLSELFYIQKLMKKEFDKEISLEELTYYNESRIEAEDRRLIYSNFL